MFIQKIKKIRSLLLCVLSLAIAGCSNLNLFDKDNTPPPSPLAIFKPEITPKQLWGIYAGGSGNRDFMKLSMATAPYAIFVSSTNGTVTSINKPDGHTNWKTNTGVTLTTGPAYGDNMVVVGSLKGTVFGLSAATGRILWTTNLPGTLLAQPAIGHGVVVVKTTDGTVRGLSVDNGQERWNYHEVEPNLILHTASAPKVRGDNAFVGFANGNLARLSLDSGQLAWQHPVASPEGAFAIQRMIDIDADPVLFGNRIYAATYQGKIASMEWENGRTLWSNDISSYTGMAADDSGVYITDARSFVWSFGTDNGLVNWRQLQLSARNTSGPAIMGDYVVVGDQEGYLHWLSKRDGHFAARVMLGGSVYAPPIVENGVLYAYTKNGYLVAYKIV